MVTVSPNPSWSVEQWVDYIQGLHMREIDLSLDRTKKVLDRLYPSGVNFKLISIAGTNGKGSTAELLASIYDAAGYSTGKYTSPHLQVFNERFSLNRHSVSDALLLRACIRVEEVRETTRLTFFEFGTLVAIELFASEGVDVAIMEVGLGGRLDAVNVLDADLAIVTSISIDHTSWLGDTIEKIALEKIGIVREGQSCVIGLPNPPKKMVEYCQKRHVPTYILEQDFFIESSLKRNTWIWRSEQDSFEGIPLAFAQHGVQLQNASLAIMASQLLDSILPIDQELLYKGISNARLSARCQIVSSSPTIILDVAHNEASVASLAEFVKGLNITGRVIALCGMLKDKEVAISLSVISDIVDEWSFVTIDNERGSSAKNLQSILYQEVLTEIKSNDGFISFCNESLESSYNETLSRLEPDDCLIVFGSFFVVGDIMRLL